MAANLKQLIKCKLDFGKLNVTGIEKNAFVPNSKATKKNNWNWIRLNLKPELATFNPDSVDEDQKLVFQFIQSNSWPNYNLPGSKNSAISLDDDDEEVSQQQTQQYKKRKEELDSQRKKDGQFVGQLFINSKANNQFDKIIKSCELHGKVYIKLGGAMRDNAKGDWYCVELSNIAGIKTAKLNNDDDNLDKLEIEGILAPAPLVPVKEEPAEEEKEEGELDEEEGESSPQLATQVPMDTTPSPNTKPATVNPEAIPTALHLLAAAEERVKSLRESSSPKSSEEEEDEHESPCPTTPGPGSLEDQLFDEEEEEEEEKKKDDDEEEEEDQPMQIDDDVIEPTLLSQTNNSQEIQQAVLSGAMIGVQAGLGLKSVIEKASSDSSSSSSTTNGTTNSIVTQQFRRLRRGDGEDEREARDLFQVQATNSSLPGNGLLINIQDNGNKNNNFGAVMTPLGMQTYGDEVSKVTLKVEKETKNKLRKVYRKELKEKDEELKEKEEELEETQAKYKKLASDLAQKRKGDRQLLGRKITLFKQGLKKTNAGALQLYSADQLIYLFSTHPCCYAKDEVVLDPYDVHGEGKQRFSKCSKIFLPFTQKHLRCLRSGCLQHILGDDDFKPMYISQQQEKDYKEQSSEIPMFDVEKVKGMKKEDMSFPLFFECETNDAFTEESGKYIDNLIESMKEANKPPTAPVPAKRKVSEYLTKAVKSGKVVAKRAKGPNSVPIARSIITIDTEEDRRDLPQATPRPNESDDEDSDDDEEEETPNKSNNTRMNVGGKCPRNLALHTHASHNEDSSDDSSSSGSDDSDDE